MTDRILLTNVAFTDTAGIEHTSATFQLNSANLQANQNADFQLSPQDFATIDERENTYNEVRCMFAYWRSEATRTSGQNTPLWLVNVDNMDTSFRFDPSLATYDGLTLEGKAMKYLETVLLPAMGATIGGE